MAVIAIGDFDVDAIEADIVERFSTLQTPDTPRELATIDVPDYGDSRYKVITDPEFTSTFMQIYYKRPATTLVTGNDFRTQLAEYPLYRHVQFPSRRDRALRKIRPFWAPAPAKAISSVP